MPFIPADFEFNEATLDPCDCIDCGGAGERIYLYTEICRAEYP